MTAAQIVSLKTSKKTCPCGCAIPVKGVVQMQLGDIIRCQFCAPVLVSMHADLVAKRVHVKRAEIPFKPTWD